MLCSFYMYDPLIWFAIRRESTFANRFFTPICSDIRNSDIRASYSASLLDASNLNLRAWVNYVCSGLVRINPTLDPSKQEDPSETLEGVSAKGFAFPVDLKKRVAVFRTRLVQLDYFFLGGFVYIKSLTSFLLPYRGTSLADIQAMVCYEPWYSGYINELSGKHVQIVLEQVA
ncbi:hypothetical protein Tco_1368510 [Tanacetum coccineum]